MRVWLTSCVATPCVAFNMLTATSAYRTFAKCPGYTPRTLRKVFGVSIKGFRQILFVMGAYARHLQPFRPSPPVGSDSRHLGLNFLDEQQKGLMLGTFSHLGHHLRSNRTPGI